MPEDSLSTSEVEIKPPEFIDKEEEAEAAFWRLKRAADLWRENRERVFAQEGESIFRTLGRILYIISCIFDGLISSNYQFTWVVQQPLTIYILFDICSQAYHITRNGLKLILVD